MGPDMDILTVRMHGDRDRSPLEFISKERLAYYQKLEWLAREMCQTLGMLAQEPPPTRDPDADTADSS